MSNRAIQNLFFCFSDQLKKTQQPLKNLKAIDALTHCRTPAMGVSYYRCQSNHAEVEQLHSCRHRSCYVCAHKQRLEWIEKQKARLLDVPHFHVIFTLPHEYLSLWRYNEALFARILFKASQETLLQLLAQQRHGGVTPGILIALHTWGRQLTLHPHTHCLVTAGGLDSNNDWKALGNYLVPSTVIRSVYRGKLQSFIKATFDAGELILPPTMSAAQFWSMYRSLYKKHWCVRIEERYAHGKGVVLYLARYCKGGPVDPRQLKQITADVITMSYLDHRDQRIKQQRLKPMDFITRLLQHVPPKGLHTIRYYGLYASASTLRNERCRQQCGTVEYMPHASSVDRLSMVVYCKTCGGPTQLSRRWWSRRSKGISINEEALNMCVSGSVQQVDEPLLAGGFYNTS